jgi:hypothetical protein
MTDHLVTARHHWSLKWREQGNALIEVEREELVLPQALAYFLFDPDFTNLLLEPSCAETYRSSIAGCSTIESHLKGWRR